MVQRQSVRLAPALGFLYRIGQCPKCMRQSFLLALFLVGLTAIDAFIPATLWLNRFTFATHVATIGAVVLWLVHVGVYGLRVVSQTKDEHEKHEDIENGDLHAVKSAALVNTHHLDDGTFHPRRAVILMFFKAAGAAALATAVPSAAMAFNECPGRLTCPMTSCAPNGSWCCPQGYPILSLCNCRCYQTASAVVQSGCRSTSSCYNENF